jgi:Plavaka transposase
MSFSSIDSNLISEISSVASAMSYELNTLETEGPEAENFEEFEDSEIDVLEHVTLKEFETSKPEACTEFPNEAYKDLMVLVTKHNISNKAGNGIINFFNKHSKLLKSPLPKSIEEGRKFMNNMDFPNLEFDKICIARYNDKEYFLYYLNIIHCIKNILKISNITQDFALSFENYEVNINQYDYCISNNKKTKNIYLFIYTFKYRITL